MNANVPRILGVTAVLSLAGFANPSLGEEGNEPALVDVTLHTVVFHNFPAADRETLLSREAQATAAAEAHPAIKELRAGSFSVYADFEYAPYASYVYYYTWHHQRVVGLPEAPTVINDAGYVVRITVDPDTGTVTDIRVLPRPAQAAPRVFGPEQLEAVRIAQADPAVRAFLAGLDTYPRLVFWRPDYLGTQSQCLVGQCAEVYLQVVNEVRQLRVSVDLLGDAVLALFPTDWDSQVAEPPDLTPTLPDTKTPSVTLVDHNPVEQQDWYVDYVDSQDDGIQLSLTQHKNGGGSYITFGRTTKIPYVKVWYDGCGSSPSSPCFTDELCGTSCLPYCPGSNGCQGHGPEVHSYTDSFEIHATYYIGCSESQWSPTEYGCYKYEQKYFFFKSGHLSMLLWISGPGFHNQPGYGGSHYYAAFNTDLDVDGACCDVPAQYTSSGWSTISTEHSFADGSPYDGTWKWRVTGGSYRVNVDPYAADASVWWVLRYQAVSEELPSAFDNNENTNSQDDMYYYIARRDACTPSAPCVPGPDLYTNW